MPSTTVLRICPRSYCNKTFTRMSSLDRHLKKIHGMIFACCFQSCDIEVTHRQHLNTHIRECHLTATDLKTRKQKQRKTQNKPGFDGHVSKRAIPSPTANSNMESASFERPSYIDSLDPMNKTTNFTYPPSTSQSVTPGLTSDTILYQCLPGFGMSHHALHSYEASFQASTPFEAQLLGEVPNPRYPFGYVQESYEEPWSWSSAQSGDMEVYTG